MKISQPNIDKKTANRFEIWLVKKGLMSCRHVRLTERRWTEEDGLPMVAISCPDCGMNDRGHLTC